MDLHPLIFCLALTKAFRALRCDIIGDIFGGLKEAWEWFWENILKPIVDAVLGAIQGVIDTIGTSLSDLGKSLFEAMTYPVRVLMQSWDVALSTLRDVLGPFAFLSPVILGGVFVVFVLVIWYAVKSILPGI